MLFSKEYPKLSNFIGSWFPDYDVDDLSDEEVVTKFVEQSAETNVKQILNELEVLLQQTDIPYDEVGKEANLYFSASEDCSYWLRGIQPMIKEKLNRRYCLKSQSANL